MARIAWIDDDPDTVIGFVEVLLYGGHDVDTYATCAEALRESAELSAADVLIVDWVIQPAQTLDDGSLVGSGLDLLSLLRQTGVSTPAIVMSAAGLDFALMEEGQDRSLGVVKWLDKFIPIRDVEEEILTALDHLD